ncbi:MAG: DUF4349 domain-containing protein [Saccharofermentanales bacterium]
MKNDMTDYTTKKFRLLIKSKRCRLSGISLIFLLIICLSSIYGCSPVVKDIDTNKNNDATVDEQGGYLDRSGSTVSGAATSSNSAASVSGVNESLTDRKVIFTASIEIETIEYEKSIAALDKMIDEYEGYIQESNVETGTPYQSSSVLRTATYTIRIPADKFKSFLSKTGRIGNIILNNSKGEDVTDTYFDTKAHIESLAIQEDRLLELLKKATLLKDILDLEDRLSQVRYEIEQLTGNLNELSSLAALSTVNIKISEVEIITVPEPEGFWAEVSTTFSKSINALVNTLRVFSLILVALSPFILTLALILLVVFIIYRYYMNRKKKIKKDAV